MSKISLSPTDVAGALRAAGYSVGHAHATDAVSRASYWTGGDDGPSGAPGGGAPGAGGAAPRASTMWVGSEEALDAIGVRPGQEVVNRDLGTALLGRHVVSGRQVRRPGSRKVTVRNPDGTLTSERQPRVTSVDQTYGAPKSLSALHSQASAEMKAAIQRAMLTAADAAVRHMTQTKDVVHRRVDGQRVREPARGAAVSLALHTTARTAQGEEIPSPHLHVHALIVGVVSSEGKLVTPDSAAFYMDGAPLEGGAVFRAVLAHELVKLGYEVEAGTGKKGRFFEVRGVPEGLVERMSGRTRDVERRIAEIMRERGEAPTGGALSVVASETRRPKDRTLTEARIAEAHRALAEEFGFTPAVAELIRTGRGYDGALEVRMADATIALAERFRLLGPTVSVGEARAMVYESAPGRLTPDEMYELVDALERSGELIALEGKRATMRWVREMEQRVMDVATAAATRQRPGLSARARATGVATAERRLGHTLEPDQVQAFEMAVSGTGWSVLTGRAGTGKGPVQDAVAAAFQADGWQVIGSVMDGTGATRLSAQLGMRARTFASLKAGVRSGRLRLNARTVLILDEATKLTLEDWNEIADWVQEHGVTVMATGHQGQHEAITLPGIFPELLEHPGVIPSTTLKTIRRHRHKWLRDHQIALDEGRAHDAVKILVRERVLHWYDTRAEAMEGMVASWDSWRREYAPDESLLVVSSTNEDVDLVNVLAQEVRYRAKELTGPAVQAPDREYHLFAGDVVVVRGAPHELGVDDAGDRQRRVENGQHGIVTRVDPDRELAWVKLKEPGHAAREVVFHVGGMRARWERATVEERAQMPVLRLRYASHSYPAQGDTVLGVESLDGHENETLESVYTAHSRARDRFRAHLARMDWGTELTDTEREALYARGLKDPANRRASIYYKVAPDERLAVAAPAMQATPERPERSKANEAETVIELPAEPFERYEHLFDPERAERLSEQADRFREEIADRETAWLQERLAKLGDPFGRLDGRGALETQRLEGERRLAVERSLEARAAADALDAHAAELTGRDNRREREGLEQKASVQRKIATREGDRAAKAEAGEERLRAPRPGDEKIRHLGDWVEQYGDRAAMQIGIERELEVRLAIKRRRAPEEEQGIARSGRGAEAAEKAAPALPEPDPGYEL